MNRVNDESKLIENLYIKFERRMFGVAYGVLHNRTDAEDAVHYAFETVIEKLSRLTFENDDKTCALLAIITKNIALNMVRNRKKLIYLDGLDRNSPLLTEEEFSDISSVELSEALERLPEDVKHAITLRFVYGFSAEECAELLHCSTHAFYRRIRLARKLLKDYSEV